MSQPLWQGLAGGGRHPQPWEVPNGPSAPFGAHVAFCGAHVPISENVASVERLPDTGAFVAALPMKITGGSGGPLRIAARVP